MRFWRLLNCDFTFQKKYGIWLVYIIFTVIYICVLRSLPDSAVDIVGSVMVFTDPAAMGLFFMGAILLLEKSQRVNCSLAVSPITPDEYILSKVLSLMVTGTIVGSIIFVSGNVHGTLWTVTGVATGSILFSLCGLLIAVKVDSLNIFVVYTVPLELFITIPAILYLFDYCQSDWFIIHPGVAAIRMITKACSDNFLCLLSIMVWNVLIYLLCKKTVILYFRTIGGGKAL